jgi:energy-coupling factor transport system ATP-binding protein
MPMNSPPAIRLQSVHFTYRRNPVPALSGIDLSVPQGAFAGIIGANGAGKSSLCFTFNRVIPAFQRGAFEGSVEILGKDISSTPVADMAATVGVVLQDFETQIFSTSLLHEVAFVMENLGVPRERMLERATHWLKEMNLTDLMDQDPATLSGGQKQRLALASVLAAEPPVLVLDEPTTDLDPVSAMELIRSLQTLVHSGRTVVLVTHDLETLNNADFLFALADGEIAHEGTPSLSMVRMELLETLGVRPPQLARVFHGLGIPEFPETPESAAQRLITLGYRVKEQTPPPEFPPTKREILNIEAASFGYSRGKALFEELNLTIGEAECIALLGPNGSGKTSLVNLIAGIRKPWGGSIRVDGRSIHELPPPVRARQVGIVFQNPDHQIFQASCLDEVSFGLRNIGVPVEEIESRAQSALDRVNLGDKAAVDPFTMTKGERKKLALASVLACEPRLLLLDEPTTGLDAREQDTLMAMISGLVTQGHTVLFITHSIALASRYAARIVVLSDGKMLLDGPPTAVLQDETRLAWAGIIPPPAVRLGKLLGAAVRTPEDLIASLVRES